jgi:hypothetical protein
MEEQKERDEDTAGMPQKKLSLAGGAKKMLSGRTAPKSDDYSEIEGYGRQLAEHIDKLHGGAYRSAFMKGLSAYGNPDVAATPVSFDSNVPQKAAPKKMKGAGHMVGAGKLKIEHEADMEGCGTKKGQMRKTARKAFEGMGKLKIEHDEDSSSEEEMEGGLLTGRFEGEGKAAPAKADSRKSRAAVVKKVMQEKKLNLAQASKYVKEHGLWKKD